VRHVKIRSFRIRTIIVVPGRSGIGKRLLFVPVVANGAVWGVRVVLFLRIREHLTNIPGWSDYSCVSRPAAGCYTACAGTAPPSDDRLDADATAPTRQFMGGLRQPIRNALMSSKPWASKPSDGAAVVGK